MKRCAVVYTALLCASVASAQAGNHENTFSSTLSGGIRLRAIVGALDSVLFEVPAGSTVKTISPAK
ncbi:MAG TPA: hypothetical protein VGR76_01150 [Candidatus Angelobacter sp.]|nr:hypothetical protein [Candidatus Angelobacter sp.]